MIRRQTSIKIEIDIESYLMLNLIQKSENELTANDR